MDIIVRTATLDDLKSVQELNLKLFQKEHKEYDQLLNLEWTFGEPGTKYYTKKISEDDGCVLVAIVDGVIVGYLCGGLMKEKTYRNLPLMAELENTFILEEFRSKGIGKKLYKHFIEWCKSKDVQKVRVEASSQNNRAIKFYKDNGFKEYSTRLESDI